MVKGHLEELKKMIYHYKSVERQPPTCVCLCLCICLFYNSVERQTPTCGQMQRAITTLSGPMMSLGLNFCNRFT